MLRNKIKACLLSNPPIGIYLGINSEILYDLIIYGNHILYSGGRDMEWQAKFNESQNNWLF